MTIVQNIFGSSAEMLTKRSIITALAGLNILLLTILILGSYQSPSAFAQMAGRRGDFITATAKPSGQSYDVLYLLDVTSRKLHAFYPSSARSNNYLHSPPRDLEADFGRD